MVVVSDFSGGVEEVLYIYYSGGGLKGSNGEVMGEVWGREGVWAVGCDGEVG